MRLTRILLWSTGILLAAILVGCLMLALFFPRDSFEDRLKGSLNDWIRPLRVDFSRIRLFWNDGPGLSVDELRLFASGTQAGHDAFLSAGRLTFRPSLEDLTDRQVALHFIVESPVFRSDQAEGEVPALAGIVGALAKGLGAPQVGQRGAAASPRPEALSALVPLPAGFTLTGVSLEMRDGSLDAAPSSVMSGMRASLRVDPDLSFKAELRKGTLRWGRRDEKGPLRLSSIVGAEIRGRAVSLEGLQVEGTLRLEETVLEWRERTATVAEPVKLAFRLQGMPDRVLSIPEIHLAGPGLEIGMAGSTSLKEDGPGEIQIRDLLAKVENWQAFCSLAFPEAALSGKLSVLAERLEIDPGRIVMPALREGSFGTTRPEGVTCEGLALRFTEGRVSRANLGGTAVSLDGLSVNIEQQEGGWTGTAELAGLEAAAGETLRVSGPASVKASWSERGSASTGILVVDLTRGRLAYKDLLDKPPDVSLQLGVRAHIRPDEIRVGRAFLNLGDTEWTVEGSVRDPARPFLNARLATDIVSLEALATISPVLKEHALGGRVEIKELTLTGRLGAMRESAVLKARVASKDLTVHGTSVKGVYGQALYGDQKLTIDPVVIQPTTGMISAAFSADFSEACLQKGLHQYYGTLQIDHVEMDELLRLVSPRLEGKARGIADANLAFRGTGLAWPEAAATLEAKARVYVNHLALDERLEHVVEGIDAEETVPQEEDLIHTEQERLLTANRAAGWFTMREGSIHTDNLVAIYEGRLIEIQGSVDLAGRLQVEKGKLFNGGRMVPFRLDCRLGEERCRPSPDLEEMGKSAAAELSAALRLLSEATQGVYRDLSFQIGDSHRIKPNSPKVLPP